MHDNTVPSRLTENIDYKIIGLAVIGMTLFFYVVNYTIFSENDAYLVISIFIIIMPLTVGVISVIVSLNYLSHGHLLPLTRIQKAYLSLGIGYVVIGVGESFYLYNDYVESSTVFTTVGELCFALFYPFVLGHLFLNMEIFATTIKSARSTFIITIVSLALIAVYVITTYDSIFTGSTQDQITAWYYVVISSITLVLTLKIIFIFKGGILQKAWLLLLIAFVFNNVGDIWYQKVLATDQYSFAHPLNVLWYAGYSIAIYALFKHIKAL